MQGLKSLVFLAVLVALLGLASAAPVEEEFSGMEQRPAMLVSSGPAELSDPAARSCNNAACRTSCLNFRWGNGFCLTNVVCLCHP